MIYEDLQTRAYETFVYPNLELIDINCKKLNLKDETIKYAKDLVSEYIKKTYHHPPYSHIKFLLPSFVYIATIVHDDRRTQYEIAKAFGSTKTLLRKWYMHIKDIMELSVDSS